MRIGPSSGLEEGQDNSLKIMQSHVGLQGAISVIENTLTNNASPLASRINFRNSKEFGHAGDTHGVDNESIVNDGLESFLNRSKVHIEFEDDIANMRDVYDVMTEEEICKWKLK